MALTSMQKAQNSLTALNMHYMYSGTSLKDSLN